MKNLLAITAALSLTGCVSPVVPAVIDTVASVITPADAVGDKVVLEGTRGLILAHNAYQAAAVSATVAIKAGYLSDDKLTRIENANKRALALLNGADATLSNAERAAAIFNAANEITRAIEGY